MPGLSYAGHVATRDGSGATTTNFTPLAATKLLQERKEEWLCVKPHFPAMTEGAWREHMCYVPFNTSLHELATFEPFATCVSS